METWYIHWLLALITGGLALFRLFSIYKYKALLHPSVYFLISWLISIFASIIVFNSPLRNNFFKDARYVEELFSFVWVTNLSIYFFLRYKSKMVIDNLIAIQWKIPIKWLKIIGVLAVIAAFYKFFSEGFNLAGNREQSTEALLSIYKSGEGFSFAYRVTKIISGITFPFVILSGFLFSESYLFKKIKFKLLFLFIPLAEILLVIVGGGRAGIISMLMFFGIGLLISIFSNSKKPSAEFFKLIRLSIIPVFLLSFYINLVSQSRSESVGDSGTLTKEVFQEYSSITGALYGLFEYSVYHVWGYQLRRDDLVTEELEMGQYTFQTITRFNIPGLSTIFAYDMNLANILGLKIFDHTTTAILFMNNKTEGATTTASVYQVLFDDFGYWGTLLAIVIFAFFTQVVFVNLFTKPIKSLWSLVIFLFVFGLWKDSWMSHHLNGPVIAKYVYAAFYISVFNRIGIKG